MVALLMVIASIPVMAQDDEEAEAPTGTARFRVVQTSPVLATAVIFRDDNAEDETPGTAVLSGLRRGSATRWIEIPAGTYWFTIGANSNIAAAAYGPTEVTFEDGDFVTLAPVGEDTIAVVEQNFAPIPNDTARVTLFHGAAGVDAIDVINGEEVIVNALAYPGSFFTPAGPMNDGLIELEVPAGTTGWMVVPNGLAEPVLADLSGTTYEEGVNYFVAVTGTADAPDSVVVATSRADYLVNVVEMASANDDLSMLVDLIEAADPMVLETLMGNGPFTVFAPTNEAIEAALEELDMTAEELAEDTDALTWLLRYHVVGAAGGGVVTSDELTDGRGLLTLSGDFVEVTVDEDGNISLNDSVNIITADMDALNGVVHVVDGVLMAPEDEEAAEEEETEEEDEEDEEEDEEEDDED